MSTSPSSSLLSSGRSLSGRVAVVTGASSGIGAATAELLAARGASVALLARRDGRLKELAAEITAAGGTAIPLAVDVTSQESVDAAARAVVERIGAVDLVVNNAGVMLPAPVEEQRIGHWQQQIDLNVMGAMRVIGAFVPQLVTAAGEGRVADLVNVSSIAAQYVYPNFAVYSGTKAFVSHASRHLRVELGAKGVRVSIIEPGIVATELQSHVTDPGANAWLAEAKATMEWLQPEDIAEAIAFIASQPKHVNLMQVTVLPTRQAA